VLVPSLLAAWVVAAPFSSGALIARSPRLRRRLARVYPLSLVAGWLGLALLAAGAYSLDGPAAAVALAAGGPLAGLSFWSRKVDDGDDGGGEEPTPDDDPPPSGDGMDWDAFERAFRDYVARERRPRLPVGHA
jgi:hypothetical protein